jgi:hypothetical protein
MVVESPMAYIPKTGHDPRDLDVMRASREALHRSYELLTTTRPAVERYFGARSQHEPAETHRNRKWSRGAGRLSILDDDSDHGSPDSSS